MLTEARPRAVAVDSRREPPQSIRPDGRHLAPAQAAALARWLLPQLVDEARGR
jgi:hypothetical protein